MFSIVNGIIYQCADSTLYFGLYLGIVNPKISMLNRIELE